ASPSWRVLLRTAVEIEIDFATKKGLPGFLSESYIGDGTRYTGDVGIPEITADPGARITDAASLYSLGVAYTSAPERVERFLEANWRTISSLLTEHGPWEGYNISKREVVPFETTAHTLSLILGLLGTGSANMSRYAERAGLTGRLEEAFKPASEPA